MHPLVTLACVLAILAAPAQVFGASTLRSSRLAQPPIIDGDSSDWKGVPFQVFKKKRIALAVANDGQYLYVSVRFKDPIWLRSFARHGVTLWPSAKGQKKRGLGLRYHFQLPEEAMAAHKAGGVSRPQEQPAPEADNAGMLVEERIEITDATGSRGALLAIDGNAGPAGSLRHERGLFTCEFRVPLAATEGSAFTIPASAGDTIRLGISFGGRVQAAGTPDRKESMRHERMDRSRSASARGRRTMDSSRARRESRGDSALGNARRSRRPNPYLEEEVWVKIQLH